MVEIITACHTFIQACKSAQFIYNILMDKTVQLIDEIGSIELHAAKECLNKARYSSNKKEEISRAITIMISAREKLSNNNEEKFETSLLIALFYHFINEHRLSLFYLNDAKSQFNNWVDSNSPKKIHLPSVAYHMAFLVQKNIFVVKIESLGLVWKGDMSIPEWRRNFISSERDLREGVKHAKEDFKCFVDSLFT